MFPLRTPACAVTVWKGEGSQGGGAYSILTGVVANHSFKSQEAVSIADFVPRIGVPEYPRMPSSKDPVTMPPKEVA